MSLAGCSPSGARAVCSVTRALGAGAVRLQSQSESPFMPRHGAGGTAVGPVGLHRALACSPTAQLYLLTSGVRVGGLEELRVGGGSVGGVGVRDWSEKHGPYPVDRPSRGHLAHMRSASRCVSAKGLFSTVQSFWVSSLPWSARPREYAPPAGRGFRLAGCARSQRWQTLAKLGSAN